MRVIPPTDFKTMPWKNGGGITHEILKEERDGRLLWRLSIAEVASGGPFSLFPGLSRILTVIEGEGLALQAPDRELRALPFSPVAFSGDVPISSKRIGGNVRDFNVIFDADAVAADLSIHDGGLPLVLNAGESTKQFALVLGEASIDGRAAPHLSLIELGRGRVEINYTGRLLLVSIRKR
jgi:environmental stress-induced protein Ves